MLNYYPKRRRRIKDILILLLLATLLLTHIPRFSETLHLLGIQTFSPDISQNETQFYFETDTSFRLRLKLQEQIQFGSRIKRVYEEVFNAREGYNESFLDSIPIIRDDIPDFLPDICRNDTRKYRSKKKISVIINYHNELLSLLLRSVYSVVLAIPPSNFQELILIDDGSNLTSHQDLLEVKPLVSTLSVPVRFTRFEENKGLIYSRRYGCQRAVGDAVLVLDSHIEVKPGFIEPLLRIVDNNYKAVAAPVFDFWDTFEDKFFSYDGEALGFDRYLTWISVGFPKDGKTFQTPAILGGAFVATKKFLAEVDYFGRCMEGWGYENIEIAMKTWMCGGELVYVPCSRVLHYAAKRSPMFHGERKRPAHYLLNAGIVVKSFFSEETYQDFNIATGVEKHLESCQDAVDFNREMLKKNKCTRDFAWLRRKLMPDVVESFDEDTLIAQTLSSSDKCLTMERREKEGVATQKLHLVKCDRRISTRDHVRLTKWGDLRIYDRQCLDWGYEKAMFFGCHRKGGNQATGYDIGTGAIFNKGHRNWCLGVYDDSDLIEKGPCNPVIPDSAGRSFVVSKFNFKTVFNETLLRLSNS